MKSIKFLIIALWVLMMNISCTAQPNKKAGTKVSKADQVEVFYFHFTRRCVTCQAVEKVSREAVAELYGNEVSFKAYNLDRPEGEKKGSEMGVSEQTLLVVKGDTRINLTNEGFMYARTKPEKLKKVLEEKIKPLL